MRRPRVGLMLLATAVAVAMDAGASRAAAQQDTVQQEIRASQARLTEIRAEREQLQRDMRALQGRVHDISAELSNIERQVSTSAEALRELDFQTAALAASVSDITQQLVRSRDRLSERQVVLNQRLRAIYRQGPLHATRVLLSAQSFSDLLNRYKYLHLVSVHDRLLMEEITALERDLALREREIQQNIAQIEHLRAEKLSEFAQLQSLEQTRTRALRDVRGQVSTAERQIQRLAADERRLTGVVEALERRRLDAERRRAAAGATTVTSGSLSATNLGRLQWPVQGELLYRFGPERRPNGVMLRRNGIGIRAQPGTPVSAIERGTVVVAGPMEGFGRGVVLSHGEGYYTLYLYMGDVRVQEGEDVPAGHILGAVGRGPEEGSHLYLQIHAPIRGQSPTPVDPLAWLRQRD